MKHSLESLCSLLNAEGVPINADAEQQLRIWTAEADGWKHSPRQLVLSGIVIKDDLPWTRQDCRRRTDLLDWYPTSLDAIYAAEKRAGLHDAQNLKNRDLWEFYLASMADAGFEYYDFIDACKLAFATPAQRCVAFILTMQEGKEAQA